MNIYNNTILITGGATGIGFALAEELLSRNNTIILCGRREEKLSEAKKRHLELHTIKCDLSIRSERKRLFDKTTNEFPDLNILINNAGIQFYLDFLQGVPDEKIEAEIGTNLIAPIELYSLFIPHLLKQDDPAIINVTSGLAFIPRYPTPIYCATKAAMHSFSMSLRLQLQDTPIKIFELAPPTVDTELDKGERARRSGERGISAPECVHMMIQAIENDRFFAPIGQAENLFQASRSEKFDILFERINGKGR